MAYFLTINGNDYSNYVNILKVAKQHHYKQMTTASGNTLVKYINSKRIIEVGIIPIDSAIMARFLTDINKFNVTISFRNPETNVLEENIKCIIPDNIVEYYTIQSNNVMYKAFTITIQEL